MKSPLIPVLLGASLVASACEPRKPAADESAARSDRDDQQDFVSWAKSRAILLTTMEVGQDSADLLPLKSLIGDARIVLLGESGHGVHEFLAIRNRLFEFLVQELGFTAIAAETGFHEGTLVDDYVMGVASADRTLAVQGVFQWGDPTEENAQLAEWMRRHNEAAGRPVRFYGVDLTGGAPSNAYLRARQSVDAALAYVARCNPDLGAALARPFAPLLGRFHDQGGYDALSAREREVLTSAITGLVAAFDHRGIEFLELTPEEEYARAHRHAVVAQQLNAWFRERPASNTPVVDYRNAIHVRASAMASNFRWALDREGPMGRVLLFAHNMHVQKAVMTRDYYPEFYPNEPRIPTGRYLASTLREDMVVIGMAIGAVVVDGSAQVPVHGSVDADLSHLDLPLFALDLRRNPPWPQLVTWLNTPKLKWSVMPPDRGVYGELVPQQAFDAMIFVDRARVARYVRHRAKGPRDTGERGR